MNKRNVIQFCWAYLLLFGILAHAQVGINIEKPEADLDVNGDIRLRKLANYVPYNRVIVANDKGELGQVNQGDDSYTVKEILYRVMPGGVSSTLSNPSGNASNQLVELGLSVPVIIEPYTTVAIAMEYNVPIVAVLTGNTLVPSYIGITLLKKELTGAEIELEEGSRKSTFYNVPVNYGSARHVSIPVSGKATDIISNNSPQRMYVTYAAKGYIEDGHGTMYYGSPTSATDNYGTGVFVIQIYEKRL